MKSRRYALDGNYKLVLEDIGVDVSSFLRSAHLAYDLLEQETPLITGTQFFNLWEVLTQQDEDFIIPLKFGKVFSPEMFSPVFLIALSSENGISAFKRLKKYKPLVAPVSFNIEITKEYLELSIKSLEENQVPLGLIAFELVFMKKILDLGTRTNIVPIMVMTKKDLKAIEYELYFGTKPIVGDSNSIRFKIEDVQKTFVTRNKAVWDFYLKGLDKRIEEIKMDNSFSAAARTIMVELLPSGDISIEKLAHEMGYSKRTIQRRFTNEKTSFKEQLNHVREMLAKQYLAHTCITTNEVAFLLGYNETNSFIRAFKLWTGKTVREYRNE